MALDEPREADEVFEEQGITFLMEKELFDQVKPVNVDFIESDRGSGFKVSSSVDASSACGTSCSC